MLVYDKFSHMDAPHLFTSSLLHCLIPIFFFFFLIAVPSSTCYAEDDNNFTECSKPFNCGKQGLKYPFWGDDRPPVCGREGFNLTCGQDNVDEPLIYIGNDQAFRVIEINESGQTMIIQRKDLWEDNCPEKFINTTLNETLFERRGLYPASLLIIYVCPVELSTHYLTNFNCTKSGSTSGAVVYLLDDDDPLNRNLGKDLTECKEAIEVLVPLMAFEELQSGKMELKDALNRQFELRYKGDGNCLLCEKSGGICGSNSSSLNQFVCLCRDQPDHPQYCKDGDINLGLKLLIGFGAAGGSIIMMLIIFFIYKRRTKKKYLASSYQSRIISSNYSSMTDLEKMGSFLGVHIFTYDELEEATNNFDASKELGDGGFGTVYYGKLKDGRAVAVKRLYENNCKRVEQFMNEVEILTRLRHQNLVLLYGCTSRRSHELLLVYEYIPNGTVADHLHGERAKPGSLPWPIRLKIAIETASALAYLHATDIIHRDVKTNNILLDNNFCVKVADFGLSRLFPLDVTHVSTAPQGTPGYVDPDYHQCYQLTDKSDVYSFGVVLIELISSKPAVDITRHRHEINLSNMAINKIQNHALHELVDLSLGFESDCKVNKMMTAVAELAFQCLHNEKDIRPTMEEVVKSLKDIQSIVHNVVKPEDAHTPADDVVLLKKGSLALSPDSVTAKWTSSSSTSNASG